MPHHALIIDDEPDILELLDITLSRMGIVAFKAKDIHAADEQLEKNRFDLCLTDMKLPDGNGIDLVKKLQLTQPKLPVAVFTAHGNMDTAIEAMKAGAFDFINKPVDLEQLRALVNSALSLSSAEPESVVNDSELIKGQSKGVIELKGKIKKLSRSQAPVFISGESGSGKELVARSIHLQGPRAEKPFIAVNCGAIPSDLVESEFFGYKKGSFTGAQTDKQGLFQAANGGTLFLDEIADLPLDMQVKLLRAIQEKAVRAIGDSVETKIDVRILSASHKDLPKAIQDGLFRADLYYRVNVIEVSVPPLREREGDILLLTDYFLKSFAEEMQTPQANLSDSAKQALLNYDFPGNVRELENILERAFTLCDNNEITEQDLQLSPIYKEQLPKSTKRNGDAGQIAGYDGSVSIDEYLEEIEKEILLSALEENRWNRTSTAKSLGITFRSLRYRLKKLGLDND
ncbi:two-component system response regulator PilR [Sessilibacter sp. MAH1]